MDVHGLGLHALFLCGRLVCCASHLHGFMLWPQVLRNYLWNGVHCCEYGRGVGLSDSLVVDRLCFLRYYDGEEDRSDGNHDVGLNEASEV